MKLLFIDDERNVVLGLQRIVDWERHGFKVAGVAGNGQEGLQKIQTLRPDIVLLDIRMPGQNGLDVIRSARQQGFIGEFILLTAHADFDYAHEAIRYGVVDYLLKPVDEDELLHAVLKAEKRIMENSVLDVYGDQSLSTMRSALLESALIGRLDSIALRLGLNEGEPLRLIMICCARESMPAIRRILDQSLGYSHLCCLIDQRMALLLQGRAVIAVQDALLHDVSHIDSRAVFFCGKVFFSAEQLPAEFHSVTRLISRFWFIRRDGETLYTTGCLPDNPDRTASRWTEQPFARAFCDAIDRHQTEVVQRLLDDLRASILAGQPSIPEAKAYLLSISRAICKHVSLHLPNHAAEMDGYSEPITLSESLNGALLQIARPSRQAIAWLKQYSNPDICQLLLQYLELHYAQPLQLQNLARDFSYDPAYLGKLLKQKTGFSFNAYLDHVRLQHACTLLQQGKPIALIAQLCGYNSVEYFSHKFRKAFGCSPTQYRRQASVHSAQPSLSSAREQNRAQESP